MRYMVPIVEYCDLWITILRRAYGSLVQVGRYPGASEGILQGGQVLNGILQKDWFCINLYPNTLK